MKEITSKIARGDFSSAEKLCRQLLEEHPDDITASFLLAYVLWRKNQPETALRCCRQTLALNPLDPGLLSDLGAYSGRRELRERRVSRASVPGRPS